MHIKFYTYTQMNTKIIAGNKPAITDASFKDDTA